MPAAMLVKKLEIAVSESKTISKANIPRDRESGILRQRMSVKAIGMDIDGKYDGTERCTRIPKNRPWIPPWLSTVERFRAISVGL
jgi:hypothetical protein